MTKKQINELSEIFEKLGADDPSAWAASEVTENFPQLARFLFLRQAWRRIVPEGDTSWIEREIEWASANPGRPTSGLGVSLGNLLALGAKKDDINEVIRVMQYRLLHDLCYLLEDPGDVEDEVKDIYWQLYEMNSKGKPSRVIGGLYESVLSMDPTGREMRPNESAG